MEAMREVLLATDFSPSSEAALERACQVARALGARLTLLHVYSPGVQALGAAGLEEGMAIGRDVHAALGELKDKATGVSEVRIELVSDASPAAVIVDFAGSNPIDLIVLGSHGHGAAKRFLLGSVAERVVRYAPCSVLVAR